MDELEKIKIYAQMLLEVVNQAELKRYQEKKDAAHKAIPQGALVHYSTRYAHTRADTAAPGEHSPLYPPTSINQARRRTR